jgi:ABC-type branched-subunit amino acid transport system substrate-binding protein
MSWSRSNVAAPTTSRSTARRPPHAATLIVVLVLTACSVTTPRHGSTRASGGGNGLYDGGASGDSLLSSPGAAGGADASGASGAIGGSGAGSAGGNARAGGGAATQSESGSGSSTGASFGGVSASDRTGVTSNSIVIAATGPFSAPGIGAVFQQFYDGALTWRDEVNDHGGIHGRKVVLNQVDDAGTVAGAVSACKQIKSSATFMVIDLQDAGEVDCLDQAGIPVMVAAAGVAKQWHGARTLQESVDFGRIVANYDKTGLGVSGEKLGVIYTNDPLTVAEEKGFASRARALGMNIVDAEAVQPNQSSFVSELSRLHAKGAQAVMIFALAEVLGILRDAKVIGYAPTFSGVLWCVDEFAKAQPELFAGVKCLKSNATTDRPQYKAYQAESQKYGHTYTSSTSFGLYGVMQTLGYILNVAGLNLDRQAIPRAFNQVRNYNNHIMPPITWAAGAIVGTHALFPVVCCNPDNSWKSNGPASEFG